MQQLAFPFLSFPLTFLGLLHPHPGMREGVPDAPSGSFQSAKLRTLAAAGGTSPNTLPKECVFKHRTSSTPTSSPRLPGVSGGDTSMPRGTELPVPTCGFSEKGGQESLKQDKAQLELETT